MSNVKLFNLTPIVGTALLFLSAVSPADEKIDYADKLKNAKRVLQQIKDRPSRPTYESFIEHLESLKDEPNVLYLENGKETSYFQEVNHLIDEVLSLNSPWLYEKRYAPGETYDKLHQEDAALDEKEGMAELAKAGDDPKYDAYHLRHLLCQRYAFTSPGRRYFDEILSSTLEKFTSKPEDYARESAYQSDSVTKGWRAMKLGDQLLELKHVRNRMSPTTLLRLAMLRASYGDVAGVNQIADMIKDRGPESDTLKFGGEPRSFAEILTTLKKGAEERFKKNPALASVSGSSDAGYTQRWVQGGAMRSPVVMEDGFIVVGWRNRDLYFAEPFEGVVVLNPATFQPVFSIPVPNAEQVFKAGKNKVWVTRTDYRHDIIATVHEYDPESRKLHTTGLSVTLGNQVIEAEPLWDEKNQTLIFPLWSESGVAWLHAEKGLLKSWRVTPQNLNGKNWDNVFLRNASQYITTTPAIYSKTGDVVVGSDDGKVYLLNNNAQMVAEFQTSATLRAVAFLSDGRIVAGTERGTIHWLQRPSRGRELISQHRFETGGGFLGKLAVLSDDRVVVSGRVQKKPVDEDRLLWLKEGKGIKAYQLRVHSVFRLENDDILAYSPDRWVAVLKDKSDEFLPIELGLPGKAPIGTPVHAPDGGFLISSERHDGTFFWLTPWDRLKDKVLWPTSQLGVVRPF